MALHTQSLRIQPVRSQLWLPVAPVGRERDFDAQTPLITPTLGAELLTDGGLENWASATNLTSWTEAAEGASTVNQESAAVHGGSNAARYDGDGSSSDANVEQAVVAAAGAWLVLSAWVKRGAAAASFAFGFGGSDCSPTWSASASYVQYLVIVRTGGANPSIRLKRKNFTNASLYWDDVSVKALTFASCLGGGGDAGTKTGAFDAFMAAVTAGTQCGLITHMDNPYSPRYLLLAYHNGTQVTLDKLEAGTWSNLIPATTATWVANAQLRVDVQGSRIRLFYGGVQKGSTQSLQLSAYGTLVRGFSTYAGNDPGIIKVRTGLPWAA